MLVLRRRNPSWRTLKVQVLRALRTKVQDQGSRLELWLHDSLKKVVKAMIVDCSTVVLMF